MRRSIILLRQLLVDNMKIELLREYYTRLSRKIIKNPRLFILWPISIAFILSYPAFYSIYTSHGLGCHSYISEYKSVGIEHTSLLQFNDALENSSDLEVRQLWIQRSFLGNQDDFEFNDPNALRKDFLLEVLDLQEKLTDGIHLYNESETTQRDDLKNPIGLLHSPLQYWDNSKDKLIGDNVLKRVHTSASKKSAAGLTLSHTSLFSGIIKINGLVKSADSILISLLYVPQPDSNLKLDAGDIWDRNLLEINRDIEDNDDESPSFLLFSKTKREMKFQKLYLRFSSMNWVDDVVLIISYIGLIIYFILSLSNIHSVKSRIGLLTAFIVETFLSVLAAVSLSSYIFKDLDFYYIPLQVLPFVVIVVGMENMLGLVNAISVLPEELPMSRKLSMSLSTRGLSSTLIVIADLLILLTIIPFVGSSTRQFCVFAAISLVIDHFLHLTYFVAVLSVDIRRLDLEDFLRNDRKGDILSGADFHHHNNSNIRTAPWKRIASKLLGNSIILPSSNEDMFVPGRLSLKSKLGLKLLKIKVPVTTTIAGSIFLILFLIFANFRLIDSNNLTHLFGKTAATTDRTLIQYPSITNKVELSSNDYNMSLVHADRFPFFLDRKSFAIEISQALRKPSDDYTTKDFKFSILVEEPALLIHKDAFNEIEYKKIKEYNAGNPRKKIAFKDPEISFDVNTIYKFDLHYLLEFLTSLVFVCSICGLILKIFIKDEEYQILVYDDSTSRVSFNLETPFSCKDLANGHYLDVIKITTSSNPFIISVGMDHKILVWSPITQPMPLPTELPLPRQLWPVTNVVMSDPGNLIAVFSKSGYVKCWSRLSMSWAWTIHIEDLRNSQYLEAYFRKKTAQMMTSRKKMTRQRFLTVREGEDEKTGLTTRKLKLSRAEERSKIGTSISRTLSIDSTFDRSTDLKLLQQNQDYDFIIVLKNGKMITILSEDGSKKVEVISTVPLITADKIVSPRVNDRLVCNTEEGKLVVATAINNKWKIRSLPVQESYNSGKKLMTPMLLSRTSSFNDASLEQFQKFQNDHIVLRNHLPRQSSLLNQSISVEDIENEQKRKKEISLFANTEVATVSFVGMIVRTRGLIAELIDVQTGTLVKRFNIGQFKPGTFEVFHSTPVHCRFCGSASVSSFSICYTELDRNTLILQTFSIDNRAKNNICLRVERDPRETRCLGFDSVTEHQHWLDGVEGWCVSDMNMILGIRKKEIATEPTETVFSSSSYYTTSSRSTGRSSLTLRNKKLKEKDEQYHIENIWEGFSMSASGKVSYHDIGYSANEGLLIKAIGPVAKFGHKSIVVSFGNVMKVLYTGNSNLFDAEVDTDPGVDKLGFINRRKRMNVVSYQMTHSTDYGSTGNSPPFIG